MTSTLHLNAGRYEEYLLLEAQLLAVFCGVIRIEHRGDVLGLPPLLDGLVIGALVEGVQAELRDRDRLKEPQVANGLGVIPRDGVVVGLGIYLHVRLLTQTSVHGSWQRPRKKALL